MWNKAFWKAVAERMVRGGAIAVGAVWIGADGVLDIAHVTSWEQILVTFAAGALGSLILCLIGGAISPDTGPSLAGTEVPTGEVGPTS